MPPTALQPNELLRSRIRDAAGGLPRGGGYLWPSPDKFAGGVTQDLVLGKERILRAGRGTYCCGITLEVFWRGWTAYARDYAAPMLGGISAEQARVMQRAWFCIGTRKGVADALVPLGLGVVVKPEDAQPGDFAQFWRRSGLGHSVMVLGISQGRISYFSTQRSTNGIGSTSEPLPDETYVVRPVVPR